MISSHATKTTCHSRSKSYGFSIVELMVAMALSLLLLAGVIAIFTSSRVSYETTDRLSRIQENGRFALDQVTRDIRSAGFVGCARAPTYLSTALNSSGTLQWNFLEGPIRGYEATGPGSWSPALDTVNDVPAPADNSDVLVLRGPERDAEPLRLQADTTNGTDDLVVPAAASTGLDPGDVALAYSCEALAYFQVTSSASEVAGGFVKHGIGGGTSTSPGNAVATINYAFRKNAEVIPVQTSVYYIRESTAVAAGTLPAGTTSLWRRIGRNAPDELVEGVEQMQLQFGVDTSGDAVVDEYRTADTITDWSTVYSVSVALLVRSLEEYGTETDGQTYTLLDVTVPAAADRRMREVFTATAGLRNRTRVN